MPHENRLNLLLLVTAATMTLCGADACTAGDAQPTNDLPNPYRTVAPWGKLPEGKTWGALNAVAIDNDGNVLYRIPDPIEMKGTSPAEGVAVDAKGNVYGGEVGPRQLVKHISIH